MRVLWRNLALALAFIALAWIVDAAIDVAFFHEGTFLGILFSDVPPVELYMRVSGAVTILAFATVLTLLSRRTDAALEALRESEGRHREYVDNAPDAVFVVDGKGRYIDANEGAARLTGYALEELLTLSIPDITPADELEEALGQFGNLQVSGRMSVELGLVRKDGITVPTSLDAVRLPGDRYLAFCSDITERKRAEAAREGMRAFIQTVIDSLPDAILVLNPDYSIALANRAAREPAGGADPVAGCLKCHQLSHHSAWPCAGGDHVCPLEEVMATKASVSVEHIHPDAEGHVHYVEVTASPILDAAGEVVQVIESSRDITDRKRAETALRESEERFRDLVESTSDWVWEVDAQGRYTYCSDSVTRVLGYTPQELLGKSPFDLMPAAEAALHREISAGLVSEKGRIVDVENWNISKDGREVCLLTNGVPILDGDGELIGYRGADRDITERRRMEEELLGSRDRLRSLAAHLGRVREEERRLLARELHDEVAMSLMAMRMDLSRARGGFPEGSDDSAEWLSSIFGLVDDAVARVNRLSDELRSPILELIGLEPAVQAFAEEVRGPTGIEIELSLELGELRRSPERDLSLFRIFQEAISNVIRHAGARRVEVTLRRSGEDILLEISDDGIGIAEERIQSVDSYGLMGMRERAVAVGGNVEISGATGGGTRVVAVVPMGSA